MLTGLKSFTIDKHHVDGSHFLRVEDIISVELPLQIVLYSHKREKFEDFSVTMRTPGEDKELVVGFLLGEGIIKSMEDVDTITVMSDLDTVAVNLQRHIDVERILANNKRHFSVSSSCGVCGGIRIHKHNPTRDIASVLSIRQSIIFTLAGKSLYRQQIFNHTGGIHACSLFSTEGELLLVREDVGRHNALDKLIGYALIHNWTPLRERILLLSGRVSYELVQKSAMAGIRCICSLGAPSSLAIETAQYYGLTLIGFITKHKFNRYTSFENVVIAP